METVPLSVCMCVCVCVCVCVSIPTVEKVPLRQFEVCVQSVRSVHVCVYVCVMNIEYCLCLYVIGLYVYL